MGEREQLVVWIKEAVSSGARINPACTETNISLRTYRQWVTASGKVRCDMRPLSVRPVPHNKLSDVEVTEILTMCNQAQYASLPPSQIVPRLADDGMYLASESTFCVF